MLKPDKNDSKNGPSKVLNAPVNLGAMAANLENNVDDIKSIWVMQRDDSLVSTTSTSSDHILHLDNLFSYRKSMPEN